MIPAVAELYRVFQDYQLGDDFYGCPDCVSVKSCEHLASIPLGELSVNDLDRYAFKAMSTWGDVRHFKHFLPRLMELTLDQYQSFEYPEVLLGKLAYAKWETWPKAEQNALLKFLTAFWQTQLERADDCLNGDSIKTVLGGLAYANVELQPFLEHWLSVDNRNVAMNLAALINESANDLMTTGRIQGLWNNSPKASEQIANWMASDSVLRYLNGFNVAIDVGFPYLLNQLEGLRAAVAQK